MKERIITMFSRIYSGVAMQKHGWKTIAIIFSIIHFTATITGKLRPIQIS